MMMRGVSAPQLTTFREDGTFDSNRYSLLSSRLSAAGVTGIFVCGTSGEFVNMTLSERKEAMKAAKAGAGRKTELMFNVTALNKRDMAELIEYAKKEGADCLSVTPPFYHPYDASALKSYFNEVSRMAEGTPVFLYNIPGMAKNTITPAVLAAAAENENIVGIKDSSMDHQNLLECMDVVKRDDFTFLTGNDAQLLTALQAGAHGGVIAMAGVYPELCVSIFQAFVSGNLEEARKAQRTVMVLRGIVRSIMPIMSHKYMLELQGFPMGPARFPFRELTAEEKEKIRNGVEKLALV